jgi:membrane protease YdiL (CAAX protease family)
MTGKRSPVRLECFREETRDTSVEKLVTVATFDFPAEAEAHKIRLEQEGIRVFLGDDNLVGANWFLANAVGGVKLQVAAEDAQRAAEILDRHRTAHTPSENEPLQEDVVFACQECGKTIAFPGERRGHVEVCPHCGRYVDVPRQSDQTLIATQPAAQSQQQNLKAGGRTTAFLWFEVFAVLCLAYVPALWGALTADATGATIRHSFTHRELSQIIMALETAMPLLVIMALSKDSWATFGIVRPKYRDIFLAGAIWFCRYTFCFWVKSMLPATMFEKTLSNHAARDLGPNGVSAYCLLLIGILASSFAEELVMRGYLIPRLQRLLRSAWMAILITSLLFGSYHLYQGLGSAILTVASGLVYAVAFCLCRRLWPVCLAHALWNFYAYLS